MDATGIPPNEGSVWIPFCHPAPVLPFWQLPPKQSLPLWQFPPKPSLPLWQFPPKQSVPF